MPSVENRLSVAPLDGAAGADSEALVCLNILVVPDEAGVSAPKPVPNPAPEKLKPDAEPKPEGAGAVLLSGAAKEKAETEGAGVEPNPEGGGAAGVLPKPAEDGAADTEPNPLAGVAKLKLLSCSDVPKPLLPKPSEDPNPVLVEPKPAEDSCGAVLFSSLNKAARVVAFITLSS